MSYSLDGLASNSRVEYVSGVTGSAYPVTIACWCYCTNAIAGSAIGMNMVSVMNSAKTQYHALQFVTNTATTTVRVRAGTHVSSLASATPTAGSLNNKWTHVAGVFRTSSSTADGTSRWCIVNGRNRAGNSTGRSTSNMVDVVTGATGGSITRQYEGYLAEVGIWNVVLSDDDIYALSRGAKPTAVQPDYLVHYVPFVQNTNDIVFGQSPKTVQGATPLSDHPARYG